MEQGTEVYQKYNSFVGIRHKGSDARVVLERLHRLKERLADLGLTDYQIEIVQRACDSALGVLSKEEAPPFYLHDYVTEEILRLSDEELPRYLFYRYRYEVFPQQKVLDDFPPCVQIEPASICNYRCVFCYQTDSKFTDPGNGHMGMMPLGLFKEVIDQVEGRCEAVTLASRGEPLINRHIENMLDYARGKFLAFKINTNAWFLDEKKSHAILEAGVSTLVISADAASEPLYSQLRVNGKLKRVVENVARFQDIRQKHYPKSKTITRVSGVKVSEGQSLNDMDSFWGDLVDQVAFVAYNPWENTYQRPINHISTPCSDLWRRTFVWFDGTVNPCDVDYKSTLAVGTVKTTPIESIWKNEKYSRLRSAHLMGQRNRVYPCNRCTLV